MQNLEDDKFFMPASDPSKKDKKVSLRIPLQNANIHLFQEVIVIKAYKVKSTAQKADFKVDDKTFIGSINVIWKECPNKELEDGTSKILDFNTEMSDPEETSLQSISGAIAGNLKWIKFGGKGSKYNAQGVKQEDPKAQKTAKDFKGSKVGEDGTLALIPKTFKSNGKTIDLKTNYEVKFHLTNSSGENVGETKSMPTKSER